MHDDPVTSREPFPHPSPELALDLDSAAVRLLERRAHGSDWTEIGSAPLAGSGFRAGIEALRQKAETRGPVPLTLLLPAEQILIRRYVLGRGGRDRDEALRRIAADTGQPAGTLTVALSPAENGELVTVLATWRHTVQEALDYARRWGFRPHAVSTRAEAGRFGGAGPSFELAAAAPRRSAAMRVAAVVAGGLLVLGLGASGSQGLMPPDSPGAARQNGPTDIVAVATAEKPAPAAGAAHSAARPAPEFTAPEPDATARATLSREADSLMPSGRAAPGPAKAPTGPAAASGEPEGREAGEQHRAMPQADSDLAPRMAGIEGARAEPEREIVLAASEMAPRRVAGRPVPRPTLSDVTQAEEEPADSEGSDAPGEMESNSRLAVSSAPRPAARPERTRGAGLANMHGALAPGIADTAVQTGLALGATSLIGVIDARSGREALVRLPSGDFLKVSRGDSVAGWRVSAIGQDTMRLTRGGESRTLLLVTR